VAQKQEIQVSEGNVRRDFTYIDDIVQGIVDSARLNVKYDVFNLGNHDTVALSRFIKAIENSSSKRPFPNFDLA
jgi:UDP-glucuronate 4-epimerase